MVLVALGRYLLLGMWFAEVVLKHSADSTGHVVAKVPNGEVIQVLAQAGDYAHVRWNAVEGFVRAENLVPEDSGCLSMGSFAR